MDWERLKELLEKYWAGLSDLDEEREIAEMLFRDDLPEHFQREKALFDFYATQKGVVLEQSHSESYLISAQRTGGKRGKHIVFGFWNILKVAAAIVVVATAGWLIREEIRERPASIQPIADTFEDPEQAFEETKKALKMLSRNLSKGRKEAEKFKAFNEAQEKARHLDKEVNEEQL